MGQLNITRYTHPKKEVTFFYSARPHAVNSTAEATVAFLFEAWSCLVSWML